jgi:hypothetical protein
VSWSLAHGRRVRALVAPCALSALLAGCASPTAPPAPPAGGQRLVLDRAAFDADVEPVLMRQGCDATGDCHGGGIRGTLQLSPPTAKDPAFDFAQIGLQVWPTDRDHSPLLTAPLVGGTAHPFKPFASAADSDYQALRGWVMSGVVK